MLRRHGILTLRREDGRVICERVKVADTLFRRAIGFLGRRSVAPDEGVVLRPNFSIHTFFIRFPIDVVFLDQDLVVLRIVPGLRPFRTASCRGAREVVELRAGECERRGLAVGDRVAWASASHAPIATVTGEEPLAETPVVGGNAVVASSDVRFTKLARFLLGGRGIHVSDTISPDQLVDIAAGGEDVDVVLLDAGDDLADALRALQALRAERPDLPVVVAGEGAAERALNGVRVYHRWDETDDLMAAVESALREQIGDAAPATEDAD
jgi:uncharacterized membrane protein (UPF0127 family)/CheY-like chemotaxis protein